MNRSTRKQYIRERYLETIEAERDIGARHYGDHRPDRYLNSTAKRRRREQSLGIPGSEQG